MAGACAYMAFRQAGLESVEDLADAETMQNTSAASLATPIQVPEIQSDEPLAVIPVASAAPLDGPPDGERINTFALAPKDTRYGLADFRSSIRERVASKPLTSVVSAFALGVIVARVLR